MIWKNRRSTETTGILGVLVAAIAVAALPLALGVSIIRLVPVWGEPRTPFSWWSLLHFLWIYALLYVLIGVLERSSRRLFPGKPRAQSLLEDAITLLVLTALYHVFFERLSGALAAALLSFFFYYLARPRLLPREN